MTVEFAVTADRRTDGRMDGGRWNVSVLCDCVRSLAVPRDRVDSVSLKRRPSSSRRCRRGKITFSRTSTLRPLNRTSAVGTQIATTTDLQPGAIQYIAMVNCVQRLCSILPTVFRSKGTFLNNYQNLTGRVW